MDIDELIEKIAKEAFDLFLKNKKIDLKNYVSDVRDNYIDEIGDLPLKEGKDKFYNSRLIYVRALEKAQELNIKKEKEAEIEREIKNRERNRRRQNTIMLKYIDKITEEEIQDKIIEECLKNNGHLIEEEDRLEKVPNSSIQKYFDKVGYEGEMEAFKWRDWQKEKEEKEKEERENTEEQEKNVAKEIKPIKQKIKKVHPKDGRLMDLFGENNSRK